MSVNQLNCRSWLVWITNIVANSRIRLYINPNPPNVHRMGTERRSQLGYLGSVWLAAVSRSTAREPVCINVGEPRCASIVVWTNKVRVYFTSDAASFFIAADNSLCETLTDSCSEVGFWDERGGVDSIYEAVRRSDESWESEKRTEHGREGNSTQSYQ